MRRAFSRSPSIGQARIEAQIVLPDAEHCASEAAMFAGSPLVLRQDFPCDLAQARQLFPMLLDVLAASGGEAATAEMALRAALTA